MKKRVIKIASVILCILTVLAMCICVSNGTNVNLYNKEENETAGYYKNGELKTSTTIISTGLINVSGIKNVGFGTIALNYGTTIPAVACYDSNKQFKSDIYIADLKTEKVTGTICTANLAVPEGTSYIRINISKGKAASFVVVAGENMSADKIYEVIGEEKPVINFDSPLYGKSVLFIGDSLCEASTDNDPQFSWAKTSGMGGWAARFAYYDEMKVTKTGVSGRSIANNPKSSGYIANQLTANKGRNFDYVIIEGGVNDGWFASAVGSMADGFDKTTFDQTTFCGGFEYTIATAKELFPDAKLGFVLYFRVSRVVDGSNLQKMAMYWDEAIRICEKWDLPYLDLYYDKQTCTKYGIPYRDENAEMSLDFNLTIGKLTVDGCHPNGKGYDRLYNAINDFMISLTPKTSETPIPTETPVPTVTPVATVTPEATTTPEATATPEATVTPEATTTPEATATPETTAPVSPVQTKEPTDNTKKSSPLPFIIGGALLLAAGITAAVVISKKSKKK